MNERELLRIIEDRTRGPLGTGCGREPIVPVGPMTHNDIIVAAVAIMVIVGVLLFAAFS